MAVESDSEVDTTAIEAAPVPDRAARAAAARAYANFASSPGVPKNKTRGVIKKKKKIPVIVIDDDSDDNDDGYDTDDSELEGIPKLVKKEYNSSDDKSNNDDVSPQEDDAIEIEAKANSGKLSPDAPLGRVTRGSWVRFPPGSIPTITTATVAIG